MASSKKSKKATTATNGNGDDSGASPPSGDGETTGRFIVVFKDEQVADGTAAKKVLTSAAGIRDVASASDYEESAVEAADLEKTAGMFFDTLGIAVVSADSDAMQSLATNAAEASSSILAIEPEYRAYALQGLTSEYLRGFRDAANHFYEQAGEAGAPLVAELATFQDTPQLTWGLQTVRADTSRFSGKGVKVAVLDTGLDLKHPDFKGRPLQTKSFVSGQSVQDGNRHGTHCIGTSCGPKVPASGVRRYGVAHGATIFAGKVLGNQGSGSTAGIVAGIEWALVNGCQIISMSLGANVNQKVQQYEVPIARALARGNEVLGTGIRISGIFTLSSRSFKYRISYSRYRDFFPFPTEIP